MAPTPPPPAAGAPPPARPEGLRPAAPGAGALLLALVALYPVGLAAQALQPLPGLAWTELFVFLLPAAALTARASPRAPIRPRGSPGQVATLARLSGLGAAAGLAGFVAAEGVVALWAAALPRRLVEAFDLSPLFGGTPWSRGAALALAAVAAPACEEVAFRGALLPALLRRGGPARAIAWSTLAFAAFHLDPVRFPSLLLLGALFGWLAWRGGSILPAVAAHAANNAAALLLTLGSADAPAGVGPPPAASAAALALGLAALAPLLLAFRRHAPAPAPRRPEPGAGRWPRWIPAALLGAVAALAAIALAPRR